MTTLEILTQAIKERKPISFQYIKPGKTSGNRIGNTHAIFLSTKNDGTQSTHVHIVQTSGVTDEPEETFPKWNTFKIEFLTDIEILENAPTFEIDPLYKPNSPMYSRVIEKI